MPAIGQTDKACIIYPYPLTPGVPITRTGLVPNDDSRALQRSSQPLFPRLTLHQHPPDKSLLRAMGKHRMHKQHLQQPRHSQRRAPVIITPLQRTMHLCLIGNNRQWRNAQCMYVTFRLFYTTNTVKQNIASIVITPL